MTASRRERSLASHERQVSALDVNSGRSRSVGLSVGPIPLESTFEKGSKVTMLLEDGRGRAQSET